MPTRASDLDLSDGPAKDSRLFLVDANGLVFRAYYALPEEIATTEGFPTNALLGFANMLMKLLGDYTPQGVLMVWDEKPTVRLDQFPDYKATRRPMPDLLRQQQPHFRPLAEAFGYRNISVEGREADDVIGTLSRIADEHGIKTCVLSTDRDAFQLVSPNVSLMMTPRGVADVHVYTPERVAARLGIPHDLVPDYIGLKGDTSDNIPGVPGIGEKTAAELLAEFGSLDQIYAKLPLVKGPKRRDALRDHERDARLSKALGTIERRIPELGDFDIDHVVSAPPDRSKLKEAFRQFEFRALLSRIDELDLAVPAAAPETEDVGVSWREVAPADVPAIVGRAAVCAIAWAEDRAALDVDGELIAFDATGAELAAVLAGPALVAHDFKALPHDLSRAGLAPAFDTFLAAYLIDPGRSDYKVEDLLAEAGMELRLEALEPTAGVLVRARGAALLRDRQAGRLADRGLIPVLVEIEQPLIATLSAMEDAGVRIDRARLAEITGRIAAEVETLEERAYALAGHPFAIGSPKQLGTVLFDELALPADRKGKTGYSTDTRVLQKLRDLHPLVAVVERWRELTKLRSTYLDPLPLSADAEDRVHTTFSQTTAATGRLSSTNPNLQNIPIRTEIGREIRGAFTAAPGTILVSADYSLVELRILAFLSGEPVLCDALRRGDDVHRITAAEVLGRDPETLTKTERDRAKAVNYGIIYGISSYGLSENLRIPRDEAQAYIDAYLARYPKVREFIARTIDETRERGFATTLFGRRRPVPELRAQNWNTRSLGERLAVNSVIQGSAADIIKLAMIGSSRRLRDEGLGSRLVLQIHDELLFEAVLDEEAAVRALVAEEMVGAYELDPPLVVDVGSGPDWLQAKS